MTAGPGRVFPFFPYFRVLYFYNISQVVCKQPDGIFIASKPGREDAAMMTNRIGSKRMFFRLSTGQSLRDVRYTDLFWLFMLGSVMGFVLEGVWCVLLKGHWEHHAATVWGPFCIIYGIGAVAVYFLSLLLKGKGVILQFAAFTMTGAAVEYFGSLFQEVCFGSVSWDYSGHALNIGGRVSFKMALLWGGLGIVFVRALFPFIGRLLIRMRGKGWRIACAGLTVFMAVNLLVTSAAVSRWKDRMSGAAATGVVAVWLDEKYDDQRMAALFPNMRFKGE